jgi:ribonuclease D
MHITTDKPPRYEIVANQASLQKTARAFANETVIAVDLEADSMFHYQEKVCLLQMASRDLTAVIDTIKINDLTPLKPIFADPDKKKVLHGADYDVRSLYRDFQIEVHNLLDTQLASMFLGIRETGLEAVLKNRFGVKLNKKFQKKDWSQRPLPDEMIAYAAGDVAYLISLAGMIESELAEKGRLSWVREECQYLSRVRPTDTNSDPLFLRCKGAGRLAPRNLAVLEALLQLRNEIARSKDRPLFKVFSNASLLTIAQKQPGSIKKLAASKAVSRRQMNMYGRALLAAVNQAKAIPRDKLPRYPRRRALGIHAAVPARIRAIKAWRDHLALEMELDPALLLNKALISTIAVKNPSSMDALGKIGEMKNWQKKTFGRAILEILNGSASP